MLRSNESASYRMTPTLSDAASTRKLYKSWCQFSLRALLALVFAISTLLACLKCRLDAKRQEREALAALALRSPSGITARFNSQAHRYDRHFHYNWTAFGEAEPPGPSWLRTVVGDDFFADVFVVCCYDHSLTDADLAQLEALPALRSLFIVHAQISDAGLAHISRLKELRNLALINVPIGDEALRHIQGLTKLRGLQVIAHKGRMTDSGLAHLQSLKNLEVLILRRSEFTEAGIARLQENLPNCHVLFRASSPEFPVPIYDE